GSPNDDRTSTALASALLVGVACGSLSAFTCLEHEQCVDGARAGTCQPDGYCSFDDPTCPSGQRYGEHAGMDRRGACVDTTDDDETGGDTTSSPETTTLVESTGETSSETTACASMAWHRDADGDGFG